MVTAFVLVNVHDQRLGGMAKELSEIPGVSEVHIVAGEYDLVCAVRVGDNRALSELITEKIVHVPGVLRTKTLIAIQTISRFDLSALFEIDS